MRRAPGVGDPCLKSRPLRLCANFGQMAAPQLDSQPRLRRLRCRAHPSNRRDYLAFRAVPVFKRDSGAGVPLSMLLG